MPTGVFPRSKEHKENIRKGLTKIHKEKSFEFSINRPCLGKFGKNHPSYKNGSAKGYDHRHIPISIKLLGNNCQLCNASKNIDLHHKDFNSYNNPMNGSNWQRLCKSCHIKLHWKPRRRFESKEESSKFFYRLYKLRKREQIEEIMLKYFNTKSYLRANDLCKKMNLCRERIRQLRNEGFFNFIKIGGHFFYSSNYRK